MADLRELLNDAVDRPERLDLGAVGERVARHRRHRRIARVAAAALAVVALGGAVLVARSRVGGDVDTDVPPVGPGGEEPATPEPPGTGTGAGTGIRSCTGADVRITTAGRDVRPGERAIDVVVLPMDPVAPPCRIDTTASVTLRAAGTEEVLPVDGNPVSIPLAGQVGPGPGVRSPLEVTWAGCLTVAAAGDSAETIVELAVDGLGVYRGRIDSLLCVGQAVSIGSTLRAADPDDADDLPACTADDVVLSPGGDGATAQMVILLGVGLRPGAEPCRIDTTATVALREPGGGLIDLEGNPQTVELSGIVDAVESDVVRSNLTWSGCPDSFTADRATIDVAVDGFGTFEGETSPPGMCADTDEGIFTATPRL